MDYLQHHGIRGQKWGKRNGPPYPLDPEDHSAAEKKTEKKVVKTYSYNLKNKNYVVGRSGSASYVYGPNRMAERRATLRIDDNRIKKAERGTLTPRAEARALSKMLNLSDIELAKHRRIFNSISDYDTKIAKKHRQISDKKLAKIGAQLSYHDAQYKTVEASINNVLQYCNSKGYTVNSKKTMRYVTTGKHALRDNGLYFLVGGLGVAGIDAYQLHKRGDKSSGTVQNGTWYKVRPH